jgi:lactate permease
MRKVRAKVDREMILRLILLAAIGVLAFSLAAVGQTPSWRFPLALYPLIVILFGVAFLRQNGLTMAVIGLSITIILAILEFGTPAEVAIGASAVGFLNSFGVSISVVATMLMIFLMRETNALQTVSKVIKRQVVDDEIRALYIGIGFGSFLTCLGVVTPSLFPPLLIAMGFAPTAAIAIAVLGYNATTSFSLLSIPIILPADQSKQLIGFQISATELAFKISLFLPIVSIGFAFAILWVVGGRKAMRKGAIPALVGGSTLGLACLGSTYLDYFSHIEVIPLKVVGVIAGLASMGALYVFQKLKPTARTPKSADYPNIHEILRSFSPWIILTAIALTVLGIPQLSTWLSTLPGNLNGIILFANIKVNLKIFTQVYTWIFVAVLVSILTLRPSKRQIKNAAGTWARRFVGPFLAYSLYFCIAYVMAWSAMTVGSNGLEPVSLQQNMNYILGTTLASIFGSGYVFVAASLGLFGAVVGGSETSSNVLFMGVQRTAATNVGLNDTGFMTAYGSQAVAGGIASAITPAKINNAVVTIDESHATESLIMRKHLIVAILLTVITGILTGIFVSLGI